MKDRPRAIVILVAVFLLGCLAGSAGSYFWYKKSIDSLRKYPDFREGEGRGGPRSRPEPPNFKQILGLTPGQQDQFRQIVAESRQKMTEFRRETDAFHADQDKKIQAIIAEMNHKLNAILDEEQKNKFAAWQKEFESKRRPPRRRDFPPPPPPQ